MSVELIINHKGKNYIPVINEGIIWTTNRHGAPGELDFIVATTKKLKMAEGDAVRFTVGKTKVFFGFIFAIKRTKADAVKVVAYDQLRYLKNKDTYAYTGKTASEVIKMIASDFQLKVGKLANTGYKIPKRVESNTTLFDMIENALSLTTQNKGKMYVLYDDFGKLTLKNITDMKVGKSGKYLAITEESAEDYAFESTIDKDTYNQVKLVYEDSENHSRDVYMTKNSAHINRWGVLQYYDTIQKGENGKAKADMLLKLYDAKTRSLQIKNAAGDSRVRGGSMILVQLDTGDTKISNWMLVEKAKHEYKNGLHTMTLDVRGGDINA